MIHVAFFNTTGGVGKTSLIYHLAWALSDLNVRVLLADLDPQANLTALCLPEERLEELWAADEPSRQTIFGAVHDLREETGDLRPVEPEPLSDRLGLLVGDVALSTFEARLSEAWPKCLDRHAPSHRVTGAFHRAIRAAANDWGAHVVLIDVGPSLGAINRAALLAADWVVTPLNADLFSVQGLRSLGPALKGWRADWAKRLAQNPLPPDVEAPTGAMSPAGYVLVPSSSHHASDLTRPHRMWAGRVAEEYARAFDLPANHTQATDPYNLAVIKHYHSLVLMAQEARKPIFHLTAVDGVLGAHAIAAREAGRQFRDLARRLASVIGLELSKPAVGVTA